MSEAAAGRGGGLHVHTARTPVVLQVGREFLRRRLLAALALWAVHCVGADRGDVMLKFIVARSRDYS